MKGDRYQQLIDAGAREVSKPNNKRRRSNMPADERNAIKRAEKAIEAAEYALEQARGALHLAIENSSRRNKTLNSTTH